jgi:hypothetical protein
VGTDDEPRLPCASFADLVCEIADFGNGFLPL